MVVLFSVCWKRSGRHLLGLAFRGNNAKVIHFHRFISLQNQFLKRLLILFTHLFCLSISVYLRPATENAENKEYDEKNADKDNILGSDKEVEEEAEDEDSMDITNIARYFSEVCTLLGVLSYVIFQQGHEIKNQGLAAFLKQLVSVTNIKHS